jgi:hypothetical protein
MGEAMGGGRMGVEWDRRAHVYGELHYQYSKYIVASSPLPSYTYTYQPHRQPKKSKQATGPAKKETAPRQIWYPPHNRQGKTRRDERDEMTQKRPEPHVPAPARPR